MNDASPAIPAPGRHAPAPQPRPRVITVRMSADLHSWLMEEARRTAVDLQLPVSLNSLCLVKLSQRLTQTGQAMLEARG